MYLKNTFWTTHIPSTEMTSYVQGTIFVLKCHIYGGD